MFSICIWKLEQELKRTIYCLQNVVSVKVPKDYVAAKLPHVDFSKCLDRESKAIQVCFLAGLEAFNRAV